MAVMTWWGELRPSAKIGFSIGAACIAALIGAGAYWVFSTDYETVVRQGSPEQVAVAVREIEKLKIPYRVSDDGGSVEVPRDQAGRIRVGLSESAMGGAAVGFELFNNTDFSTTEFTQKINYQRALQGELSRTISSIDGVASARVHLVMPDSGFLRRQSVRATAAVNVLMKGEAQLSPVQVQGIQKLVAASVPEIKLEDIAVIDQEGVALSKSKVGATDSATQGRLELKREVDAYLEGKVRRMLATIDAAGEFSVSVDATLNLDDVKVTTEDVVPVDNANGAKATGVLVRERQSQRQDGTAVDAVTGSASGPQSASTTKEVEYKVGHRIEQVATAPGSIEHLSVAVLARTSSGEADVISIKNLIMHAIGANEERGDSVAVVMLSALHGEVIGPVGQMPTHAASSSLASVHAPVAGHSHRGVKALAWLLGLAVFMVLGWIAIRRARAEPNVEAPLSDSEVDRVVERIQGWLSQEQLHASR